MKFKSFALLIFLIFELSSTQERKICNKDWCIEWSEKNATAFNITIKKSQKIYKYKNTEKQADLNNGYWFEADYTMSSIVGNIVSYKYSYYNEGGAHPSYGSIFITVDITNGDTLNLLQFFSEEKLIEALKQDGFIKQSISDIGSVNSLEDIGNNVTDNCSYNMSKDVLISSFAFHHLKDTLVAIRIGIPHGCEANRGNFIQLGFYLAIPEKMKKDFEQAAAQKTLMKDLVVTKKKKE